jgi:hypothetical protein
MVPIQVTDISYLFRQDRNKYDPSAAHPGS